jgi:FlaA1/EpsC-like NDP-sugar epimerase
LLALDALLLPACAAAAYMIRLETMVLPRQAAGTLGLYLLLAMPVRLWLFRRSGLYARLWRYAGQADLEFLVVMAGVSTFVGLVVGLAAVPAVHPPSGHLPLSVWALDSLLGAAAIAGPRLALRSRTRWGRRYSDSGGRRALIVGAGAAGSLIVREMAEHAQLGLTPIALVDDDPAKHNRRLQGVPIVGGLDSIADVARRLAIDEVIIALPAARGAVVRRAVEAAASVGVPTRTVPGLYELLSGRKSVIALRKVEIEDLLRREPVRTDLDRVCTLARDKTVLVTGAGGSIGSELCRQIAGLRPSRLVVVGRGENSIFELVQELTRTDPGPAGQPVIADVRDRARLEAVFRATRPHVVFHARPQARAADGAERRRGDPQQRARHAGGRGGRARTGVQRFVLISSDKAVRPSSVMGATKRLAEGVVQEVGARSSCRFVSVRFGTC